MNELGRCPICHGGSLREFTLRGYVMEAGRRLDRPFVQCLDCKTDAPLAVWPVARSNFNPPCPPPSRPA